MGNEDRWECDKAGWYESIEGVYYDFGDVQICEPCNYASNMAYYHSMLRVCDYPHWTLGTEFINS